MKYVVWVLLLAFVIVPTHVQGQGKDAPDPTKAARAKMLGAAYIEGQLVIVDGDEKNFSVRAMDKVQFPNAKMQEKYAAAQRNYGIASAQRNTANMNRYAKEMSDTTPKLYDTKEVPVDFDLTGTDKLAVRTLITPTKEDGSKYTSNELLKLRGNSSLPGYPAELGQLTKGDWVRIYLDRNRMVGRKKEDAPLPVATIVVVPTPEKPAPPKK